jgi:hypothetical protein
MDVSTDEAPSLSFNQSPVGIVHHVAMKVSFLNTLCVVAIERYQNNGRIALELFDQDGDCMCTATVNLPDVPLPNGHVFIKDYSENSGILAALVEAKVIGPALRIVNAGYTYAHECKLLMPVPSADEPKLSGGELRAAEWGNVQTAPSERDMRTAESNEAANMFPF